MQATDREPVAGVAEWELQVTVGWAPTRFVDRVYHQRYLRDL